MRKVLLFGFLVVTIIIGSVLLSYYMAKDTAIDIAESSREQITPLKGGLVLYVSKDFSPRWVFRGEFIGVLTGSTYDIHMSLLGDVISYPQRPKN